MAKKDKAAIWPIEPHTQAKHELLRRYLGAWYPIMARFNPRIVYLDGFAGPGVYAAGEPGSPLIALDTLVEHTYFPKLGDREFLFAFFESDQERFGSLDEQLQAKTSDSGWPSNVKILAENCSFADGAAKILESLGKKSLAPTFAFVDPFGVSGVPLKLIGRLSDFDKCEVFTFVNINAAQRFAGAGLIDEHLEELFATDEYKEAERFSGEARREFLTDLFERQFRDVCRFKYVLRFEMVNKSGQSYRLFYGTRHLVGLSVMKSAMWKLDPSGQFMFSDRRIGILDLFGEDQVRDGARDAMAQGLRGRTLSVEEVEEYVLVETPYASTHYKKPLAQLEKSGALKVVQSTRKKGWGFPAGTVVEFAP